MLQRSAGRRTCGSTEIREIPEEGENIDTILMNQMRDIPNLRRSELAAASSEVGSVTRSRYLLAPFFSFVTVSPSAFLFPTARSPQC